MKPVWLPDKHEMDAEIDSRGRERVETPERKDEHSLQPLKDVNVDKRESRAVKLLGSTWLALCAERIGLRDKMSVNEAAGKMVSQFAECAPSRLRNMRSMQNVAECLLFRLPSCGTPEESY